MTSRETETHCVGTYSANTGSFKNPIIVLNELNSSTDTAVTNIIASLSVTLDKEKFVYQLAYWSVSLKFSKKQIYKNALPLFF